MVSTHVEKWNKVQFDLYFLPLFTLISKGGLVNCGTVSGPWPVGCLQSQVGSEFGAPLGHAEQEFQPPKKIKMNTNIFLLPVFG